MILLIACDSQSRGMNGDPHKPEVAAEGVAAEEDPPIARVAQGSLIARFT
jgi:hypothetical protein